MKKGLNLMHAVLTFFMCAVLIFCFAFTVSAYDEESVSAAQTLYDLGLFKGSGSTFTAEGANLDSFATRAELAVTITRMLGKEEKAKYQANSHPFNDVPGWASDYVGWLYENYLVNGSTDTYFGANDCATLNQFATMMLRVLGYSDSKGDFDYSKAVDFAVSIGLIDQSITWKYELVRSDMVKICLKALNTPIKNSRRLLGKKLFDEKVYTAEQAAKAGIGGVSASAGGLESYFSVVDNVISNITAVFRGKEVKVYFDTPVEEYGVRVFYTSKNHPAPVEAPLNGYGIGYMKGKINYPGGSAAGYINDLTVSGLYGEEDIKLIVIKTSSEGATYLTRGKTNVCSVYTEEQAKQNGVNVKSDMEYRFGDLDVPVFRVDAYRENNNIKIMFAEPMEEYGVRVFYTTKNSPQVTEAKKNGWPVGFTKGKITYSNYSPAGYIDELTINGLGGETGINIIIIKANSEDTLYVIKGKSNICTFN